MSPKLPEAVPPEDLRDALAAMPSLVPVITCETSDGETVAVAASSFAGASFEPPLLVVSVLRSHPHYESLVWSSIWGLSLLARSQGKEARALSISVSPLGATGTVKGVFGEAPLIAGAAWSFECVPYDRHAVGDHVLFVGEVVSVTRGSEEPLVRP